MASVREKNGRWYYFFNIKQADGKWKKVERGGYDTKREAKEVGQRVEAEYKTDKKVWTPKAVTYESVYNEWLEDAPNQYKATTIEGYRKEIRTNVLPVLMNYNLSAITPKLCQSILTNGIDKGYTKNRLTKLKGAMNQPFKFAIRMGYIKVNPMETVCIPFNRSKIASRITAPRQQRSVPKKEIEAIFRRFPSGHTCYLPLLLGYRCGLRLGEAYGLLVEDIDIEAKTIYINHQIQYESKGNTLYLSSPKYCNAGEGRVVALDDDTLNILKVHIERLNNLYNPIKYYVDDDGIVNTEGRGKEIHFLNIRLDGSYIAPRTMQYVSRVIHGKEGNFDCVDSLWDFHSLRHTHASELIANGVAPVEVQKRLGHKKLETVYRYYIHETEMTKNNALSIINQMYNN